MQDKIPIPERVEGAIGYDSWTALSWALQNGWVQDYKWCLSEMNKEDISTPFTVRMMLYLAGLMKATNGFYTYDDEAGRPERQKVGTRGLALFSEKVEPQKALEFYRLMVEGYLLGTDFVSPMRVMRPGGIWKPEDLEQTGIVQDMDGANQLEGELRRYWAKKKGIAQPRDVGLTWQVPADYCGTHQLLTESYFRFRGKLKL